MQEPFTIKREGQTVSKRRRAKGAEKRLFPNGPSQKSQKGEHSMTGQAEENLLQIFSRGLRDILGPAVKQCTELQEIRLRSGRPLLVRAGGREYAVGEGGELLSAVSETGPERGGTGRALVVSQREIEETLECAARYSLYAFEDELRQGFLTVAGGHRIGVAGRAVTDGSRVKAIKPVTCLNVRVARQIRGCSDSVLPYLIDRDRGELYPVLILSPPCCGKTTLLRDLVRKISDGCGYMEGKTVGIVDERSEIAACFQGIAQNDVGMRSDVLDGCPKAQGMMMLIRSMAPQVLAVDEIGGREDLEALRYAAGCGCSLIATAHGTSYQDVEAKPAFRELFRDRLFERILVLSGRRGPGTVEQILDGRGRDVCFNKTGGDSPCDHILQCNGGRDGGASVGAAGPVKAHSRAGDPPEGGNPVCQYAAGGRI